MENRASRKSATSRCSANSPPGLMRANDLRLSYCETDEIGKERRLPTVSMFCFRSWRGREKYKGKLELLGRNRSVRRVDAPWESEPRCRGPGCSTGSRCRDGTMCRDAGPAPRAPRCSRARCVARSRRENDLGGASRRRRGTGQLAAAGQAAEIDAHAKVGRWHKGQFCVAQLLIRTGTFASRLHSRHAVTSHAVLLY